MRLHNLPLSQEQAQEDKCCMISVVCGGWKSQTHKVQSSLAVSRLLRRTGHDRAVLVRGLKVSFRPEKQESSCMAGRWLWAIMIHASSWLHRFQMFPPQNGKLVRWCTNSFAWQSSFIMTSCRTPQIATTSCYLKQIWKRTAWNNKCKESPQLQTFDILVVKTQANREILVGWVGKGMPWQ